MAGVYAAPYDTASFSLTPQDPTATIVQLDATGIGGGVANYLTVHRITLLTGTSPVLVQTPASGVAGVPFALIQGNSIDVSASTIIVTLPAPPTGFAMGTYQLLCCSALSPEITRR